MLVALAWRNVRRNKRRSAITILAVTIGLAALTFLWAFLDGMNSEMIENTTRYFAGDAQVHLSGYHADPTLDLTIPEAAPVVRAIAQDPAVVAATARLEGKALASHGDKSRGVVVVGVSPLEEGRVTSLFKAVENGSPLQPADSTGALIGADLAEALDTRAGDELVLVGQAYDGSLSSARVPVRGVFRTKIDEYDAYMAVMPLGAVREFLAAPGGATAITLRLRDRGQLDAVATRLGAHLGSRYEVVGWPTLVPKVAVSVRYHEVVGYVVLAVFFVVVAAGVANPVLMAVLERTREFGVMLAVGMSAGRLARLVVWEAMLLGAVGLALGNALGLGAGFYFGQAGIDLSAYESGMRVMPGLSAIVRPVVRIERSVMLSALVFSIACLAALYPALKSARLDVVEAIRGIGSRRRQTHGPTRTASRAWPVFILIAARSMWRNPRRTLITAGGAAFAVFSYVFLFGYFDGFDEQAIDTATRYMTGHIQIERTGFRKNLAPEVAIDRPGDVVSMARRLAHVAGVAPRVQVQAIASSASKSEGIALIGIDPPLERTVTFIHQTVREGRALRQGDERDVVIGRKLAAKLDVRLGEKIVIMAQAADHELGTAAYRVAGIFATESASFDGGIAYVTLPAAQRLLALGNRVSTINIRLDSRSHLDEATDGIRSALKGRQYGVVPWPGLIPAVDEMVRVSQAIRTIVMAIVLAVVILAIMNTVFMAIAERTRELGVMLALGTRPWAVVRMVLYETGATMALASAIGYGSGVLLVSYLSRAGLDLSVFFQNYDAIPGLTGIIYPRLIWASIMVPGVILLLGSLLASAYPAAQAARLDPVKALRHT
jgi:ABC-type lipoprotein release transport system permease subunit